MKRRLFFFRLALLALLCAARPALAAQPAEVTRVEGPFLFGMRPTVGIALSRPEAAGLFPQWRDVLARHAADDGLDPRRSPMPEPVLKQWRALLEWYPSMEPAEKLRAISAFFSSWPGKSDMELYGQEEYWATPAEFIRHGGGDCEDYAIAKYFALRMLGWPTKDMWLVLVSDTKRQAAHAVLAVRLGKTVFVLDNLSRPKDLIMPHDRYGKQYIPRFALNEDGLWAYLQKETAKKK